MDTDYTPELTTIDALNMPNTPRYADQVPRTKTVYYVRCLETVRSSSAYVYAKNVLLYEGVHRVST